MAIVFYDLKLKKKVNIDESKVRKVTFETPSGTRYALKTETSDGRVLTKFVFKIDWDNLHLTESDMNHNPEGGGELPR